MNEAIKAPLKIQVSTITLVARYYGVRTFILIDMIKEIMWKFDKLEERRKDREQRGYSGMGNGRYPLLKPVEVGYIVDLMEGTKRDERYGDRP